MLFSAISAKLKSNTSYSNTKRYIWMLKIPKTLKATVQVELGVGFVGFWRSFGWFCFVLGGAGKRIVCFTVTHFISTKLPELWKLQSICLCFFILYLTHNQLPM